MSRCIVDIYLSSCHGMKLFLTLMTEVNLQMTTTLLYTGDEVIKNKEVAAFIILAKTSAMFA